MVQLFVQHYFLVVWCVGIVLAVDENTVSDHPAPAAVIQKGWTSDIFVHGDLFVKQSKISKYSDYKLIARETCMFKLLQQFAWCPRLVASSETTMITKSAGVPLTIDNIPLDADAQFAQILKDMASVGASHNDIISPCNDQAMENKVRLKKLEVLVKDGRLSLIDFGWGTLNGAVPCNVSQHKFPRAKMCPDETVRGLLKVLADQKKALRADNRFPGSSSVNVSRNVSKRYPYILQKL